MLIPREKVICIVCNGTMQMKDRHRVVVNIEDKDGDKFEVIRISEHWYCWQGHLRLKNYNEETPVTIITTGGSIKTGE